jgi:uncharacterized protein (TIRG00374 family)
MSSPESRPGRNPAAPAAKSGSQTIRLIIGYTLAAVCLVWVFHDLDWKKFIQNIAAINWWWIPAAVIGDTASYLCQGFRWHYLLNPQGGLSVMRTTQAIYSGMFLNEVLPLRVGELARGYLVSRWMGKPFAAIIPSMALERLMEAIWVAISIGAVALFVPLPKDLVEAGNIIGLAVLLATGLFLYFVLRKKRPDQQAETKHPRGKVARTLGTIIRRMGNELQAIGLSRNLYGAFLATFLMYACQVVAFWLVMESYGLHLSILSGAAVFLIVHLGTALPNAPANVGTYQFFCVVGLAFFGVDKTTATGFSVVVFILLTIPLWALGAVAFGQSGMSLSSFRQKIPRLEEAEKESEAKAAAEEPDPS